MSESEPCNIHGTIDAKVNCLLENISTEETMNTGKMLNGKFHAKFQVQVKDYEHGGLAVFVFLQTSLLSYLMAGFGPLLVLHRQTSLHSTKLILHFLYFSHPITIVLGGTKPTGWVGGGFAHREASTNNKITKSLQKKR